MRKTISALMILATLMAILSGCGINGENAQGAKDDGVLAQLNVMKEQNKKPMEMFDYINQNISKLNKTEATEAVGILVNTLEEYESTYNDQLFEGDNPDLLLKYFEYKFDYSKIDSIKEAGLKALLLDITLGGFKIAEAEGTFAVIVDYESLRTFSDYVEEELKEYIAIMALRYNDPAAIDASIVIPPVELEKRIMQVESYIKSHGNQQREEIMMSIYMGYVMIYMSGTDNTMVFDPDTGAINPEMFKTFEAAPSKYKDTAFGKVMSKYVALLKEEGFTNTERVQDFILNLDASISEDLK